MKPCAANRKLMVWQTLNALDAQQTRQLLAHLKTCEGCRRYLAEISHVTRSLATAEINPDLQASAIFHRRLAQKLRAAKPGSFAEMLAAFIQRSCLNWRVAVPVVAGLVVFGAWLATKRPPAQVAAHLSASPPIILTVGADHDLAPTMANYQRAANQSLDQFDALLTRQSKRALPVMPSYTAATVSLANESF